MDLVLCSGEITDPARWEPIMWAERRSQYINISSHLENIDLSTWIQIIEKWIDVDQSGER